jgi:hypothetical protein
LLPLNTLLDHTLLDQSYRVLFRSSFISEHSLFD